jgi:hypothetical protein
MLNLSTGLLRSMGFENFEENNSLEATFHSINIYQIRGIADTSEFLKNPEPQKMVTTEIAIAIGSNLNEICNTLTGDKWADDEDEWKKEKNIHPPYLMVLTNLPGSYICKSGFIKQEEEKFITYSCFTEEKEKLAKFEKEKSYPIITALSALLSNEKDIVTFHPVEKIIYGLTLDGRQIHDFLLTGHGEISTARKFQLSEISKAIDTAFKVGKKLHYKVGYFFDLATKEKDSLKRFLYYFLVLEVHTNQIFKTLDYSSKSSSFEAINKLPNRIEKETAALFQSYQKDAKNLTHRFIWCSLLAWNDVTDEDIQLFKDLKKFRDQIFHGEEVDLKSLPINQARQLALKMIKH